MISRANARARVLITMLALAIVAMLSPRAVAQTVAARTAVAPTYDPSNVARLSQMVDEAYVLGKDDVDWSYAEPNLVLEKGDLIRTNETGMAEVQFDSDLLMRIGENSRAAMVEMGKEKVIGVDSGHVYVRAIDKSAATENFFVTFPSGQLFTVGPTLARLDVDETGAAELRVVRGEIGLVTKQDGARSISAGNGVAIGSAGDSKPGVGLEAKDDAFDYWSEQRDIALSTVTRPKQVANNVVGAEDLDGYGNWIYSDTYSTEVWQPYVVKEWRPYSNGRWVYDDYSGWTWIPDEPWGYVTHHYGSWNYDPYYGWVWLPAATWYPSRVSWVEYDGYVGWVPVGYYGYPVVTTYPYYVSTSYRCYPDLLTFTFVLFDDFYYHHSWYDHDHHHHYDDDHHDGDHHDGDHWGDDGHGDHHDGDGHHHDGDGDHHDGDYHDGGGDHGGDHGDHHGDDGEGENSGNTRMQRLRDRAREATANGTLDMEKLKKANLRFASNVEDLNLKKNPRKGLAALEKLDQGKIMDVAKHPELKKKIEKLNVNPQQTQKIRSAVASNELPKRAVQDFAKNYDFRGRGGNLDKASARKLITATDGGRSVAQIAGRSIETRSADLYRNRTESGRMQNLDRITEVRKNLETRQASTPAVQRISITNEDLKQAATRFKQERYGSFETSTSRGSQIEERGAQTWKSGISDAQRERVSETLSMRRGDDRQTVTTPALRERISTQKNATDGLSRASIADRYGSNEISRERVEQAARNFQNTRDFQASQSPAYSNGASRSRIIQNYGEAVRSRSFERQGYERPQAQMSRPAVEPRNFSRPQMSSPEPSRGGDRISSGRSGGGSFEGGRAARAIGRFRANRR